MTRASGGLRWSHALAALLCLRTINAVTVKTASSASSSATLGKVVELLEDMQEEMSKEEEKDQATHDKQACWCNSNIFEKTSTVETNQRRIAALTNGINRLPASSERWTAEKEQLSKEIASAEAAKAVATTEHEKERDSFKTEETRLLSLVDEIVEAHKKIAEVPASSLISTLQEKVAAQSNSSWKNSQAFLQREPEPEGVEAVLDGLQTDVAANLGTLRSKETQRVQSFQSMMKDKSAEMKAMEEQKQDKKEAIADAAQKISDNKEVIANVEVQVSEDSELLADVKSKCEKMNKEWDQRQQTRGEEVAAIQKAMQVLKDARSQFLQEMSGTQDRGQFTRQSFLQESVSFQRKTLTDELLKAGTHDLWLVTLAMKARIDSFTEVKKAIQNMTASLEKEQKDEVKQRNYCMDQFERNELAAEEKNLTMQKQTADGQELEAAIQAAGDQTSSLQKDIDALEEQIKLASQNREKENAEFQALILKHRGMKKTLQKAMSTLQDLYNVQASSFLQANEPEGLGAYKPSGSGSKVITMLQQLIKDSEVMAAEAREAEQTSQESLEAFASETNKAIKTKKDGISKQTKQRGMKVVLLAETSEAKHLTSAEMTQLQMVKERLHESCDFLLSQFDVRQKARADEIEALKKAKLTLAGD